MDKRKPRFTDFEVSVLLDQIEKNYSLLQSKFTDAVTSQKKNGTWETISAKVNASGASHRTANDVKKKVGRPQDALQAKSSGSGE